jgi:predicted nicotinamide N-methyase
MLFGHDGLDGSRVLELGAGAGMAGASIARRWNNVQVVTTYYPDVGILRTLQQNVARNFLQTMMESWLVRAYKSEDMHGAVKRGYVKTAIMLLWRSTRSGHRKLMRHYASLSHKP